MAKVVCANLHFEVVLRDILWAHHYTGIQDQQVNLWFQVQVLGQIFDAAQICKV